MTPVEYTDEFEAWWDGLDEREQEAVDFAVDLLREKGLELEFPYSSHIKGSSVSHLRELRKPHAGQQFRILYAFDPRRTAILLIGGDKTGDNRWYKQFIRRAERLYEEHLAELRKEGSI